MEDLEKAAANFSNKINIEAINEVGKEEAGRRPPTQPPPPPPPRPGHDHKMAEVTKEICCKVPDRGQSC